jgi:hypothetical protein
MDILARSFVVILAPASLRFRFDHLSNLFTRDAVVQKGLSCQLSDRDRHALIATKHHIVYSVLHAL